MLLGFKVASSSYAVLLSLHLYISVYIVLQMVRGIWLQTYLEEEGASGEAVA